VEWLNQGELDPTSAEVGWLLVGATPSRRDRAVGGGGANGRPIASQEEHAVDQWCIGRWDTMEREKEE